MPSYADGENNFSDDDLDDLPLNALTELENNAIQSTQAACTSTQPIAQPSGQTNRANAPSSDYGDDFDDEDLDDAVVVDESRSTPAIIPSLAQHISRPPRSQYAPRTQHGSTQPQSHDSLNNRARPSVPLFQPPTRTNNPPQSQRGVSPNLSQGSQLFPALDNPAELLRQFEEVIASSPLFLIRSC